MTEEKNTHTRAQMMLNTSFGPSLIITTFQSSPCRVFCRLQIKLRYIYAIIYWLVLKYTKTNRRWHAVTSYESHLSCSPVFCSFFQVPLE